MPSDLQQAGEKMPGTLPDTTKAKLVDKTLPFIIGGCSGMIATICVQPMDMIKVRLQLNTNNTTTQRARPSSLTVIRGMLAEGKVLDFYNGLSAALARQIVYGTGRLGLFVTFEDALKKRAGRTNTNYTFVQRAAASISAGAMAAAIGNPTEVALIRMQSDGMLSSDRRKNYRSVIDALVRITRLEGIGALWGGCLPTVIRAMSTNFGQLAFFSESKHQLKKHTTLSDRTQTLTAAAIAGFSAAFFSMPFDTVKSRLQSSQIKYNGMLDCFVSIARKEGLTRFYRGFPAYFSRLSPHS